MMRVTKLHILCLFLFLGCAYYGYYFWDIKKNNSIEMEEQVRLQEELKQKSSVEEARKIKEKNILEALNHNENSLSNISVEQTSSTSTLAAQNFQTTIYVVQPGDTLWSISKQKKHFGQGHRWYDIWKANEQIVDDFDQLESGKELVIPLDKPEGYRWEKTSAEKKKRYGEG